MKNCSTSDEKCIYSYIYPLQSKNVPLPFRLLQTNLYIIYVLYTIINVSLMKKKKFSTELQPPLGEHTAILAPIPRSTVRGRGLGCVKFDQHFFFNFCFLLYTFTNYPIFEYFTHLLMIFLYT